MLSTQADSSGTLSLVLRPLPTPTKDDKLERVQKAATTMVNWLEHTKSKERLRGAGFFHLQKRREMGVAQSDRSLPPAKGEGHR